MDKSESYAILVLRRWGGILLWFVSGQAGGSLVALVRAAAQGHLDWGYSDVDAWFMVDLVLALPVIVIVGIASHFLTRIQDAVWFRVSIVGLIAAFVLGALVAAILYSPDPTPYP